MYNLEIGKVCSAQEASGILLAMFWPERDITY